MPKKKPPLPENVINVIEEWALKKCDTDENASQIMDSRIRRVTKEIQETWTVEDELARRVVNTPEYFTQSYRVHHSGITQDAKFKPEEHRK